MNTPKRTLSEMQQRVINADTLKHDIVNAKEMLRLEMLSSFKAYTKAMFKAQYKRNFIVAEHHEKIIKALQDVVDGKCRRLIINIAPRYGKCLVKGTRVLTVNKGLIPIELIVPGDIVYSYHDGKLVTNTVLATEEAYKPTNAITLRSGRVIEGSYDHPMLTVFGYKNLEDIKQGDRIVSLKSEINTDYEISDAELIFSTVMIFEGHCKPNYTFANTDPLVVKAMQKACDELDIEIKQYKDCESFEYYLNNKAAVRNILQKYDLEGHLAYDKRLPARWLNLSMRQKYMFIDMMIATDGAVDTRSGQIQIGLANEGLIQDIQQLLLSMGVPSTYIHRDNAHAGVWVLAIPRKYAQKLYPHLTFYGKAEAAKHIMDKEAKCHLDVYPYEIIRYEQLTRETSKKGSIRCMPYKNITEEKFLRLIELYPQLSKYHSSDFYFDEVVSNEPQLEQELVHLEVENDHNFIAEGLVSHNTELVIKSFISWCFALNPKCRFLHLSYSDVLVADNSDTVRSIMQESLYKELFPQSKLEKEKASNKRWRTAAGGEMYAVSTQGQVTGFGAGNVDEEEPIKGSETADNLTFDEDMNGMLEQIGAKTNVFQGAIMIDDPIKPEDADSDIVRERINLRFENTIRNRTNSRNTPIIIIMQRLHEHDLCGYLQEIEPDEWTVLSLPAIQEDPVTHERHALWPMKHTLEELDHMREINPLVFDTQYMQDPTPKEGLMYSEGFKTYNKDQLPQGREAAHKWNYTDTADTGADNLCSICFIDTPEYVYVTDVLFTDAPMEKTEPKTAEMLTRNQTVSALIESNNGGRGFSRNVKKILRVTHRNFRTAVRTFTQSEKKATRIFTNSGMCQSDILFPEGWEKKWPKFYAALMSYRKDNKKQQHDDAPDALTGVIEMHSRKHNTSRIRLRN